MVGQGFTADPDELNGIASTVHTVADAVAGIDIPGAVGGASTFGHGGLHSAMATLAAASQAAAHVLRGSATQLATGVRTAAANYLDSDATARHAVLQAASPITEVLGGDN